MSAPASRPVHPCVLNLTDGSRGGEFSTWAHITTRSPALPNLVTASASTLSVYSVNEKTSKLTLEHCFSNLAGSFIFLDTLKSGTFGDADSLLVAFAGYPRLTVLQVTDSILRAYSLLDLVPVLTENSYGSASVFEEDAIVTCLNSAPGCATVASILGGGIAVVVVSITYIKSYSGWIAKEPYILPLKDLYDSLPHYARGDLTTSGMNSNQMNANISNSIITGFGDILSITFLSGYLEPVLVLLHTDPGGVTWCGRLGRLTGGSIPNYVSALSVSVSHKRTALLWSIEVPTDAFQLTSFGQPGCFVIAASTITILETGGKMQQVIAVNGFAESTCPISVMPFLKANALVKLSIQLHGSKIIQLSNDAALVALRFGQLYVLQKTAEKWILLALGQTLASMGEVACLSSILFDDNHDFSTSLYKKIVDTTIQGPFKTGLLFAGSRMGDSLLLGFALENVSIPWGHTTLPSDIQTSEKEKKKEEKDSIVLLNMKPNQVSDEVDLILRQEEEALYAASSPLGPKTPNVVPLSDEEEENDSTGLQNASKRQRTASFCVVRAIVPLDSLINLGPLGPSCQGPLSRVPDFLEKAPHASVVNSDPSYGASAHVFPCGFGASGGLALVTVPGRDDRMILSEKDCLNVDYMCSLPVSGKVLLGSSCRSGGGIRIMKLTEKSSNSDDEFEFSEIDLDAWCRSEGDGINFFSNPRDVFSATLLAAGELPDGRFVLLICPEEHAPPYTLVMMKEIVDEVIVENLHEISHDDNSILIRVTPLVVNSLSIVPSISFSCLWSNGSASLVTVSTTGEISSLVLESKRAVQNEDDNEYQVDLELQSFYSDDCITAVDIFEAPVAFFQHASQDCTRFANSDVSGSERSQETGGKVKTKDERGDEHCFGPSKKRESWDSGNPSGWNIGDRRLNRKNEECATYSISQLDLDEEDEELYGNCSTFKKKDSISHYRGRKKEENFAEKGLFLGLCRRSGDIEVYCILDLGKHLVKCWCATGAAVGLSKLKPDLSVMDGLRFPRSHLVAAEEIRFFSCGPTLQEEGNIALNGFLLAIETNNLDISLYKLISKDGTDNAPFFQRIPLRSVARPSQEQGRHHSKLLRKGALSKEQSVYDAKTSRFNFNSLFRFSGVSGQDGLFAASSRPFWVVAERGKPSILVHRTRHASPAGGKPRPVRAFCKGIHGNGEFLTLHERVGRIGCQRLTLFNGLSTVFDSHGLLPGGGYCIEKIPLGVTVRQIKFLDDDSTSTSDHPLYAVLVSRELEVDQSSWNSDGLTLEERKQMEDDKETAKIQRQVEADLGGFDMESEWVEAIDREECFRNNSDLGGAPPLRQSAYSLWIVDAANKWMVVDSYELGKHEHGIDLQVMMLTEFREEPGNAKATTIAEEESPKRLFITVGTGIVNHNGEDVSTKGRALLFEVKRHNAKSLSPMSQIAEITLCYEHEIFHGAVTTLSCLSCNGKNRLVIGAGSDVNIEQWGSGKLTQVGFFRATMQILEISLFKNFFLLSDAYDSLYFLVWRESDKSLTLLAKDYDPIPVYAAGIMSRGAAMTFLCHDDRQNLQFFQYAPGEPAARGGNKLVCRADFHYGGQTTAFASHYCRPSLLVHSATPASTMAALKQQDVFFGRQEDDNRLGVYFGTTDGCLASVVPLSEPIYWRMLALQSVMSNAIESDCALSWRSWRLYRRTRRRGGCRSNDRKKGVIDGDLILHYADLPTTEQEDIASAIGSTVSLILDNLLEIQCGSMIL